MKKLLNTLLLLFVSFMTFAQEVRPEREGRFPDENPEDLVGPTPASQLASVDNYTILLVLVAVSLIAFFAYKRLQTKQA